MQISLPFTNILTNLAFQQLVRKELGITIELYEMGAGTIKTADEIQKTFFYGSSYNPIFNGVPCPPSRSLRGGFVFTGGAPAVIESKIDCTVNFIQKG